MALTSFKLIQKGHVGGVLENSGHLLQNGHCNSFLSNITSMNGTINMYSDGDI